MHHLRDFVDDVGIFNTIGFLIIALSFLPLAPVVLIFYIVAAVKEKWLPYWVATMICGIGCFFAIANTHGLTSSSSFRFFLYFCCVNFFYLLPLAIFCYILKFHKKLAAAALSASLVFVVSSCFAHSFVQSPPSFFTESTSLFTFSSMSSKSTVYWVPNGKSYHSTPDCRTLARSERICSGTLEEACAEGKDDPCDICVN